MVRRVQAVLLALPAIRIPSCQSDRQLLFAKQAQRQQNSKPWQHPVPKPMLYCFMPLIA